MTARVGPLASHPSLAGSFVAVAAHRIARHRAVTDSRRPGRLLPRIFRCYPVSLVVLAPFLLLIIPTAVLYRNPELGFLLRLVGLALLGSALVETAALIFGRPDHQWRRGLQRANAQYPRIYGVARVVAVVSVLASLLGAYVGRGTIVAQVSGDLPDSSLAPITALVSGWNALACALLIASHLGGHISIRKLYGWLALLTAVEVVLATMTARSAPLMGFISFVAAAGVICGVIRVRYLVVTAALLFLVWPAMFEIRNAIRTDHGVAVSEQVTAGDRARLDLQLAPLADISVPVDLSRPGLADYLRYGVLPRVVDPDRPALSTGQAINQYLGGGPTSAYTFLSIGNIYLFEGPTGVVVFHGVWAAVVGFLLRWRGAPGPFRLSILCLILTNPLLWSSTYPDSMISLVQHTVSVLPVFYVLVTTRRRPSTVDARRFVGTRGYEFRVPAIR